MGDRVTLLLRIWPRGDGTYDVELWRSGIVDMSLVVPTYAEAVDRGISWLRETRERA